MAELDTSDGPYYCQHWHELGFCDETCATCGHRCGQHAYWFQHACEEQGCTCDGFTDEKPNGEPTQAR